MDQISENFPEMNNLHEELDKAEGELEEYDILKNKSDEVEKESNQLSESNEIEN